MVASAALTVFAFYQIFQRRIDSENDLNVLQRQLRGFSLLLVSNLVMIVGMLLCAGNLLPYITSLLRQ